MISVRGPRAFATSVLAETARGLYHFLFCINCLGDCPLELWSMPYHVSTPAPLEKVNMLDNAYLGTLCFVWTFYAGGLDCQGDCLKVLHPWGHPCHVCLCCYMCFGLIHVLSPLMLYHSLSPSCVSITCTCFEFALWFVCIFKPSCFFVLVESNIQPFLFCVSILVLVLWIISAIVVCRSPDLWFLFLSLSQIFDSPACPLNKMPFIANASISASITWQQPYTAALNSSDNKVCPYYRIFKIIM